MDAIVFDIKGLYALFKKPYSALSPVSFPLPPPTAIFGLIGAIIGLGKDEYLDRLKGWNPDVVRVGVQLLNPIHRYRTGLNLLRTKGTKFFRPLSTTPHSQIPAEFLKDPAFRMVFAHEDNNLLDEIQQHLEAGRTEYTPSLGLAQCIADVNWYGRFPVKHVQTDAEMRLNCVIPISTSKSEVFFDPEVRLTRLRVPARMKPDRTVVRFEDVILDESANKQGIRVRVPAYQEVGELKLLLF